MRRMDYKQNTGFCFGDGRLSPSDVEVLHKEALEGLATLRGDIKTGNLPILSIAAQEADLPGIEQFAANIKAGFRHLIILGTGGSSLCGHALASFAQAERLNPETEVIFMPNIDPAGWNRIFRWLDLEKTAFLAISKSGTSVETIVQLLYCLEKTKHLDAAKHFYGITMKTGNPLRQICESRGITVYEHAPDIGGRFSLLSLVGLMPGVVAGLDAKTLRRGVMEFVEDQAELAAESAAIHVALMRKDIWQNVMMTYPDRLEDLNIWYRQIWAESVGKNGTGSTPVKSIGTLDQHSQMQLYLGGRKDKFYNFITVKFSGKTRISTGHPELGYLNGKTMADVINAEQEATVATLAAAGRPVRVIEMGAVDELNFGKLIAHLMIETIIVAKLLGVNPYDQPAVEDGKKRTRGILAKL